MALYCTKGSGTLHQQLLMMHGIAPSPVINDAWFCMELHGIAEYCMVLHGVGWYCIVLHCFALNCKELHGVA